MTPWKHRSALEGKSLVHRRKHHSPPPIFVRLMSATAFHSHAFRPMMAVWKDFFHVDESGNDDGTPAMLFSFEAVLPST